ncbi:uncharacterized protein LOC124262820 [Haliotis rubra]|uniref:uncharacterized protein LOC124262820 n=1 Tax=Haliotis rubra TaxID=36100 RepID=UPI001EE561BC|nr:uncharacterized protein LOC124262820 [Haliotis rubra]
MQVYIILGLCALAAAQFKPVDIINNILGWNSDRIHGWSFEFHKTHDLLLVRSSNACYLIHVDNDIEKLLDSKDSREKYEDQIYQQIQAHTGESKSSLSELRTKYHDIRSVAECFRHSVYDLTPSSSSSS